MCCRSLFPQEGCPLERHGRVGQSKAANDFGECKPWTVRVPCAAVHLRRSVECAFGLQEPSFKAYQASPSVRFVGR